MAAQKQTPIPLAIPTQRRALARMYIDLALAFHSTLGRATEELDASQTLVAVAVMLGHAEGRPMNVSQIAACLHKPRTSTLRRLDTLVERGVIKRIAGKYYLEPVRAKRVPAHDKFELILSQGFAVLGPYLSKLDK